MDETTQPFDYNSPRITGIIDSLSESRFQTYLDKSDGDQVAAIQLYTWNTSIAGAFYGPLQTLEILLRNKVHALLRNSHGSRWFDNSSLLRKAEDRMVQEATQRLIALGKTPTEGRVVADLSFGFWVALFANAYDETIWRTDLYRLFPKPFRNRRGLHQDLDRLRTLRNRVAHHEPIFQRRLGDDYTRIRNVVGFLSRDSLAWLDHHSTVQPMLEIDPSATTSW